MKKNIISYFQICFGCLGKSGLHLIPQAQIPTIIEILPNFESICGNLPKGMCRSCDINKFLKIQKGIQVSRPEIFWQELAQHVCIKKGLSNDTQESPCECEICRVHIL